MGLAEAKRNTPLHYAAGCYSRISFSPLLRQRVLKRALLAECAHVARWTATATRRWPTPLAELTDTFGIPAIILAFSGLNLLYSSQDGNALKGRCAGADVGLADAKDSTPCTAPLAGTHEQPLVFLKSETVYQSRCLRGPRDTTDNTPLHYAAGLHFHMACSSYLQRPAVLPTQRGTRLLSAAAAPEP